MTENEIKDIARGTHEMNRLYCKLLGDYSQPAWGVTPDWQRESALSGVRAVLSGVAKTPAEQHKVWGQHKLDTGWKYGPKKDAEKKTHPCLVPYNELPTSQKMKDTIFRAVVEGMRNDK